MADIFNQDFSEYINLLNKNDVECLLVDDLAINLLGYRRATRIAKSTTNRLRDKADIERYRRVKVVEKWFVRTDYDINSVFTLNFPIKLLTFTKILNLSTMTRFYIFTFLFVLTSTLHAQPPGIVGYWSEGMYPAYDDGTKIYWPVEECGEFNRLQIEFEVGDSYSSFSNVMISQISNTSVDIEIQDMWSLGNSFSIINSNNEVMVEIVLESAPSELFGIGYTSVNNIRNDTLFLCSDYGTDPLGIYYDTWMVTDHCFLNDEYAHIYINGIQQQSKDWNELNLQSGDTLYVKRLNGPITCPCYAQQFQPEFQTSPLIIQLLENEVRDMVDVIKGNTIICPGDTVVLGRVEPISASEYFRWQPRSSVSYVSDDTVTINFPGTYFLAEYSIDDGSCPVITPEIVVKKGENCGGFVNGYVRESGSYNSTTQSYNMFAGVTVSTNNGWSTVTDVDGYFEFRYDSIDDAQLSRVFVSDPKYFSAAFNVYTSNSFMLDIDNNLNTYLLETNDLATHLNSTRNRPGFTMPYYVSVENRGKNPLTTNLTVTLDNNLTYTSLDGENKPTTTSGQTLTWENITVESGATKRLTFYAVLDRKTALGTELVSTALLTMVSADDVPTNDNTTFKTTVTGSFDPNDKLVTYVGAFTEGYIYDTTNFEYTIRFQNTGTDTAFTVRVEDVISTNLDLTTINMLDASHEYEMSFSGDTVKWLFRNILLADSNVNEPASHGFIRFSIKQKAGNVSGTVIKNKASIFFDFNDPIVTNEVVSIVNNDIVTSIENERSQQLQSSVSAYPNPASHFISINADGTGSFELYNNIGSLVLKTSNKAYINIENLKSGVYYYQFITDSKTFSGSFVKE